MTQEHDWQDLLAETLAEEIEEHLDNTMDVDVGTHDLAEAAGQMMAQEGGVHDLYEALKAATKLIDEYITASGEIVFTRDGERFDAVEVFRAAEAALAKAEGKA